MSTIPFKKQYLAVDPVEQIEHAIARGSAVSGDELLRAIEAPGIQLSPRLCALIPKFNLAAKKRRGRPAKSKGREDFALQELNKLYAKLLPKYQDEVEQKRRHAKAAGQTLPDAEPAASELAYNFALKRMKADFPNITWETLRNKHSAWNNGYYDSSESHVDSEDVYAEIDRQFPKPKNHK